MNDKLLEEETRCVLSVSLLVLYLVSQKTSPAHVFFCNLKHLEPMSIILAHAVLKILAYKRMYNFPPSCVATLPENRAEFKGAGGPGPRPSTNRGPPTKPVIFYLSFMLVVYETTT